MMDEKVRCACYTRKSVENATLDRDFNSLVSQREACENYIASQKGKGWICLSDHYDDGGYSGGNMNRPAMQRLKADIEAGRITRDEALELLECLRLKYMQFNFVGGGKNQRKRQHKRSAEQPDG